MAFLFDSDPPQFNPADIEPLQGDGERIRSAGRMLYDAAGALEFAERAATQLETLTDGVSWHGAAFQAFKGSLEKQPLPQHLLNARNVLGWTGDELGRLATKLDDIQAEVVRLRQRADLLGINGDVPEERRPEVDTIKQEYDDLKERRERALEDAGRVFDELKDKTVFARPPKGLFGKVTGAVRGGLNFTKDFAVGFVQGTVDIGKGLMLLGSLATPWGMRRAVDWYVENRHLVGAAITYAVHNPLGMAREVGKVLVDYDTLKENPGRWLGKLAPQIAIAVATAGVGGLASRSGAIASRGVTPTGRFASTATRYGDYIRDVERMHRGVGRFGDSASLTAGQAFRKGILDTYVNKGYRNIRTLGRYNRRYKAHYLLHGRKTLPAWGKLSKKAPVVTAAASAAANREAQRQDLAQVIEQGAADY
jgi:hypothetical protein